MTLDIYTHAIERQAPTTIGACCSVKFGSSSRRFKMRTSTKAGLSFMLTGFLIAFLGQVIMGPAFNPIGRALFRVLFVAAGVTVGVLVHREERVRRRKGPGDSRT